MYFTPWIGKNYKKTRLLLISESAYSWRENGRLRRPPRNHPTNSVNWSIKNLQDAATYYRQVTRAICGKKEPLLREAADAWAEYAYWIYIPGTVGEGAGGQRTKRMWAAGKKDFWRLLAKLKPRPKKAIITSLTAWKNMPESDVHLTKTLQAYRLRPSGGLMWCLAVPHPASRKRGSGFGHSDIAKQIAIFRSAALPERWRAEVRIKDRS